MAEDDWLEASYEERYEDDLNEWETEQVFKDREQDMLDELDPTVPEGFEDIEEAADEAISTDDVIAGLEAERPGVITGGDGFGTVRRRHLFLLQPLADRTDLTPQARGMLLEQDMREAMALAARRLDAAAQKYAVTGYDWDLEDIQYDVPSPRTISATLVLERE